MKRWKSNISKLFLVCVCVCVWLISDGTAPPMAGQANAATLSPSQVALGKVIDINGHKFVKTGSDPAKGSQFTALTDFASVAKPPLQWQRGWGGSGTDTANDSVATDDGGVIVAGMSDSTDIPGLTNQGGHDIVLIKYDRNGELVWQQSWGRSGDDFVIDVTATADGGVVIAGNSNSTDIPGLTNYGGVDAILVKFDGNGQMVWQQSWGGTGNDFFRIPLMSDDEGVIVAGDFYSTNISGLTNYGGRDVALVKFDGNGQMVWQQSWGGIDDDMCNDAILIADDEVILVGNTMAAKFNGIWELFWQNDRQFDFVDAMMPEVFGRTHELSVTSDGGIVMPDVDGGSAKYDHEGQVVWEGGPRGNVMGTSDGGMTGMGDISLGYDTVTETISLLTEIVRYDHDGQEMWERDLAEFGGGEMLLDQLATVDGGVIVASADFDVLLAYDIEIMLTSTVIMKFDRDGQVVWRHEWGGAGEGGFFDLQATEGSGIYAVGQYSSTDIPGLINQGGSDIAVVKYGW